MISEKDPLGSTFTPRHFCFEGEDRLSPESNLVPPTIQGYKLFTCSTASNTNPGSLFSRLEFLLVSLSQYLSQLATPGTE
jgi:hypothetical protein